MINAVHLPFLQYMKANSKNAEMVIVLIPTLLWHTQLQLTGVMHLK